MFEVKIADTCVSEDYFTQMSHTPDPYKYYASLHWEDDQYLDGDDFRTVLTTNGVNELFTLETVNAVPNTQVNVHIYP